MQLVSVPLFINYWGVTLYGEWLILSTIPAYLAMSDMGFTSVAGNQMTMEVAAGNKPAALRTYQSAWVLVSAACMIVFGLGVLVTQLPIRDWLNISSVSHSELGIIFILLAIGVVVNLQMGILAAGFRCDGHFALGTWIGNLTWLIQFISVGLGLYLGADPIGIASTMCVVRCFGYFLLGLMLRRVSPWLTVGWRHATSEAVKTMVRPAIAFMAFPVGNAFKNQGMLTLVGIALDPGVAAGFNTMRTLVNAAQQAMSLINTAVWPEMSAAFGSGNLPLARRLHRISCNVSFWLALCALLVLFTIGPLIFKFWTLDNLQFDRLFFSMMLFIMLVNSFWYTSSVVQAATNTHGNMAVLYLMTTGVALGLAYLLISLLGLQGIATGLIVLEISMAIYVVPASLRVLKDTEIEFWKYVLNPRSSLKSNR